MSKMLIQTCACTMDQNIQKGTFELPNLRMTFEIILWTLDWKTNKTHNNTMDCKMSLLGPQFPSPFFPSKLNIKGA